MAFQIVYIFQAVDRFSKVAAKIEKSIERIEKKVGHTTKRLHNFEQRGRRNFRNVSLAIRQTSRESEKLNFRIRRNTRSMRVLASTASDLKSRLVTLAGSAVMTGFGLTKVVKTGAKINKAFINLSALTGITGKDLVFLKNQVWKMARVFGLSADEIAMSFIRVAGLMPQLLEFPDALANMAKWALITDAGMDQIEVTSRALAVALNVYGKSAENAAEFANILAAAQRHGSAEVIDLAHSFLKAGPVAEAAQIPFIELIAIMESVAKSGVLAQKSGTALRTIFIRLADMPKEFRGETMVETVENVGKHLKAIKNPMDRISEAGRLFGKHQVAAGLAMIKNVDIAKKGLKLFKDSNVAVETAAIVLTEYGRQSQMIWSVWQKQMTAIFTFLEPELLSLKREWVAFLSLLDVGIPGGLQGLAKLLVQIAEKILAATNAVMFAWALTKGGFEYGLRPKKREEFIAGIIQRIWELRTGQDPKLETILTPEEKALGKGKPGASGHVSLDINMKGNTEGVASVQAVSEGDVDVNIGKNLAFIG